MDTPHTTMQRIRRRIFVRFRAFGLQNESQFFIQNFAILVNAGMGVVPALNSVLEEIHSWRMRSAVTEILDDVSDGKPLSVALGNAEIVSPYILSLVTAGERSGRLAANLLIASEQNEKEAAFRSRVRSALAYSSFVFFIAIFVGVGTAWYILPQIATFFTSFNVPLPLLTRGIIAVGVFLNHFGYVFVPLFVVIVLGLIYFLFSFPKTRFIGHTILFHLPLFKDLIKGTEIARFGFISGTMLKAGMPITMVFEILPRTTTFGNYSALYVFMGARLQEGLSFQRLFPLYPTLTSVLPSPVRQMIVAAEQSGTLPDTLIKIGVLYDRKVEAVSRNIPAFLEPALLLVIGALVGLLALGILIPIYQIGLYF
jgi:type II secretory pathway component PulF